MNDKIIEVVKETLDTLGFFMVEAKVLTGRNNRMVRVVIYKEGADVSMRDCSMVSNVLLRRLEMEVNNFSENYDLVVESPGVDRQIHSMDELHIFKDREIKFIVKDYKNKKLDKPELVGRIKDFFGEQFQVESKNRLTMLEWKDISSARLYFDIKNYL